MPEVRLSATQRRALVQSKEMVDEAVREAEKAVQHGLPGAEESLAIAKEAQRLRDVMLTHYSGT